MDVLDQSQYQLVFSDKVKAEAKPAPLITAVRESGQRAGVATFGLAEDWKPAEMWESECWGCLIAGVRV